MAGAGRGASLRGYAEQVRRLRRLVPVVTVAALLTSLSCAALIPAGYTARATLPAATKSRSPNQDASLAAGYARYFNGQTYQGRVRTVLDVPSGVRFRADTESAGPILAIAVVATDRDVASRYAAQLADRFRTDIDAAAAGSQGSRTLLVRADLRDGSPEHYADGSTVAGLLDGTWTSALTPVTFSVGATQAPVLPAGRTGADPYPLIAPDWARALPRHLAGHCDLVVVLTPPVAHAPEAQILCAVADRTIVVVEKDATTASGGERAVGLLEQVNVPVLGAVLATRPNHRYLGAPEPFAILPRSGAALAAEPA